MPSSPFHLSFKAPDPLCSAEIVKEQSYYKENEKKTDAEEASFNVRQMEEKIR